MVCGGLTKWLLLKLFISQVIVVFMVFSAAVLWWFMLIFSGSWQFLCWFHVINAIGLGNVSFKVQIAKYNKFSSQDTEIQSGSLKLVRSMRVHPLDGAFCTTAGCNVYLTVFLISFKFRQKPILKLDITCHEHWCIIISL